jgi:hypothetical protein
MKYTSNHFLIGCEVESTHPITVLNPTKTFIVKEVLVEHDIIFVRGENTCWFGQTMIKCISAPK